MTRVLVVATSRKTRGGITSVIKAYEKTAVWKKFHCHWVQTHRDGPAWRKILYFITSLFDFVFRLPFYDTVHIHTADIGTQKRKRIFAKIASLAGKRVIVHLHSSGPQYSVESDLKDLYTSTFQSAERIIVLSTQWRDVVLRNYDLPEDKISILYNPCPPDVIPTSGINQKQKYILFAGTLTHRKGYDDLIEAFAKIASKHPDWQLHLAGNGELDNARNLIQKYRLDSQVKLLGWISGPDKDEAFRCASVYCLPSYSEGFPMGVLDAWAYHLPVVTTPVGGLPDVVIDGENCLLFTPGDTDALASQLSRVMDDAALCSKLAEASARFADEQFNINELSKQLEKIYLAPK